MWEGNNIKEQMESAHKDLKYTMAETLYRKKIVEDIMINNSGDFDPSTMDILVFLELSSILSKAE